MGTLHEILKYNKTFVENKQYEQYRTSKFPDKKMVILTCMDTRLLELLPKSMNLKNGDAKIIKNAGAIVSHPYGSIMRSIIVAVYELNAHEVCVVGHHNCGMTGLNSEHVIQQMTKAGIQEDVILTLKHLGINLSKWLSGFDSVKESVVKSVDIIKNHPLLPQHFPVHGMIIDPETGALELVADGYSK